MDPEARMKHVERFWRYRPTLVDQSDKPKSSDRKPSDKKKTRKPDFETVFDRLDKKEMESKKSLTFQDLNALEKILYSLFFHSIVPRLFNRCNGNCEDKLFPAYKEDLVFKSRDHISFMNKQSEMDSQYCPLYIYFKAECLKEYARCIHDVHYEAFPFSEIKFGKEALPVYLRKSRFSMKKLVWICQIIKFFTNLFSSMQIFYRL